MTHVLPKRPLADTGLELSAAGLGTVKIGRNEAVKYPKPFELPSDNDVRELLGSAQSLGINWLDTAPAYGVSEERLGRLIRRQDWLLATKTGEEFTGSRSHFDFSAAHTAESINRSLKRLKTDWLDIVFIHSDGRDLHILERTGCLDALYKAKDAGKIRAIGMSCKTPEGALAAITRTDCLMLTLNPDYLADIPAIEQARAAGKAVIIKKAFGSGHLVQTHGVAALADFAFARPITAITAGTLNPAHLAANCQAIASAAARHPL